MIYLDNSFTRAKYHVVVVGCGGTGGFVAEGLCRILPADVSLVLVDPDRIEERNLIRQNFYRDELGKIKSEALAHRLSRRYHRAVGYSTLPISLTPLPYNTLLIGCVDNGPARRDITRKFTTSYSQSYTPYWWVDAGNDENSGQILIGNGTSGQFRDGKCHSLPLPTLQRPELLREQPKVRSCAEMAEQGPTINQGMAVLVVEVVRRLIAGTCPWIQLYLDMNLGTLQPVFATPEVVENIVKERRKVWTA